MIHNQNFQIGDEVWAYAQHVETNRTNIRYKQEPVLGILSHTRYQDSYEKYMNNSNRTYHSPRYFIPYKKNKTGLAWSKAVSMNARKFATTKEDAITGFNADIQKQIDIYLNEIEELQSHMISIPDKTDE